ncbi:MAG: hypothetical protein U1F58_11485 [Burkholderiales bacterium]
MNLRAAAALFALAAMLGGGTAAAQAPATVARLTSLEGNVLVSEGDALVAAANNQRVAVGTRVLTMAGARVVVSYDVGCDVALKENERFTVRAGECAVLVGEVVPLGPAPGAIGGGIGTAGITAADAVLGTALLGGLGYGIYVLYRRPSVSPN